ncbi:hypothetical protein CFP56_034571 [Quercus suber]|uniref:Uncharacterized protein n=1 Tax=Quercus suber TaxID=58331 RepID=A0AAW0JE20_QUESU
MAYATIVNYATMISMFNATPLFMPVMSIFFTSPTQTLNRSVVVVVSIDTEYSIVPLISDVLHYHKLHGTTNMNIPSLSIINLKMTRENITVIFVKKNEISSNGFITMQIAVFLLIWNVFLEKKMSSNTYNDHQLEDTTL